MDEVPPMSFVAAQTQQSVVCGNVEDLKFVVMYRSMLQYSHTRGVPGVSILMTGQRYMVATRVYRAYCFVAMGRGLSM